MKFAIRGIGFAFAGRNFKIQCAIAGAVIVSGFVFSLARQEWLWIILMIALVLASETLNTALEQVVDFISPEYHALAGKIKDLAAGAVLMLSCAAIVVGLIIFVPHLLEVMYL